MWILSSGVLIWPMLSTKKLDADLAYFPDYSSRKDLSLEHLLSGVPTRVDKISTSNHDHKIRSYLPLCQASVTHHDKSVVARAESSNYDVSRISAALRDIYGNGAQSTSTHHERNGYGKNWKNASNGSRGKGVQDKGVAESHGVKRWSRIRISDHLSMRQTRCAVNPEKLSLVWHSSHKGVTREPCPSSATWLSTHLRWHAPRIHRVGLSTMVHISS